MSSGLKMIVVVLAIAAVGYGVWYTRPYKGEEVHNSVEESAVTEIDAKDTSDDTLDEDMTKIEAQLKASSQDSATIEQGMNDKQVEQENI